MQFANNQYSVLLPSVIAHDDAIVIKDILADGLSHLESGVTVDIRFAGPARYRFTKQLQAQFADVDQSQRQQKMEEYVLAMGYSDPTIVLAS